MSDTSLSVSESDLAPWLGDRPFSEWRKQFDEEGYLIFRNVLPVRQVDAVRAALAPALEMDIAGRNDFEGVKSNRVYALLGKSPVFADLVIHPLALAFAEADLGRSCLLSAALAIQLKPGESAQPWHTDDSHISVPRPRPSWGVSTFWAIDDTTEDNGATEILPGSHRWPDDTINGAIDAETFSSGPPTEDGKDPGARPDAIKGLMPAGSLMVAKGTLWHRGGANRSKSSRLIVTPQYCPGWARPLETMLLAVPPEVAVTLPKRARELLGYSIHPPFMGYVDGVHPSKVLNKKRGQG